MLHCARPPRHLAVVYNRGLRTDFETLRVKLLEKETELATEREAGEKADAKVHHLEAENVQLREALKSLMGAQAERDQLRDRLDHVQADAARKQELIDRLSAEQGDMRGQLHDKTTALNDALKTGSEQEAHIRSLQEGMEQLQAEQDSVLADLKDGHAREMAQARAEWDSATHAKLAELEHNLHDKYDGEIHHLRGRVDELQGLNDRLRQDVSRAVEEADKASELATHLLHQLNDTEGVHKAAAAEWGREKQTLMEELTEEKACRAAKDAEFDALMGVKIRLTAEIEEYRRILELEEERHNLPVAKKPAEGLLPQPPASRQGPLPRASPTQHSSPPGAGPRSTAMVPAAGQNPYMYSGGRQPQSAAPPASYAQQRPPTSSGGQPGSAAFHGGAPASQRPGTAPTHSYAAPGADPRYTPQSRGGGYSSTHTYTSTSSYTAGQQYGQPGAAAPAGQQYGQGSSRPTFTPSHHHGTPGTFGRPAPTAGQMYGGQYGAPPPHTVPMSPMTGTRARSAPRSRYGR